MRYSRQKDSRTFYEQISSTSLGKLMTAFMLLIASTLFAQSYQSEVEIIQEAFGLEKKKLQATYFKQMKKEVGIGKAAQFCQLEGYFNSIIQANIYTQIPFIGENLNGT